MIIAERKDLGQIVEMLEGKERVLVAGCRSCVSICHAGGEKEVATLAEVLRLQAMNEGRELEVTEATVERQCEKEWVREIGRQVADSDIVLSLACGVGVQVMQEFYPTVMTVPGLNTSNMGAPEEQGIYMEKCGGCGDCVLHLTGGVCPVARCSKSLLNGPCGGSQDGRCEVNRDLPCGWDQIYHSLERLGRLDLLEVNIPPKNWIPSRSGGPRRIVRASIVQGNEEKRAGGGA
ncbi:MAG: methylenetetrahydrofolate reductase C-terminal domain-containing protein [Methanomassiliicoccus sp.]|nr:methylenetetrahydrofolate reductase C-terminal domain-containing protein [Methanomassiliicoccus sp.]